MSTSTIVLVVRTRWAFKSWPGTWLMATTTLIMGIVLLLPIDPPVRVVAFTRMPLSLYGPTVGVLISYVASAEVVKHWFYRRYAA